MTVPTDAPRTGLVADDGHYRSVRGLLTAGRVGAILAGSAWMVMTIGLFLGSARVDAVIGMAILGAFVYLGGVITEIVGWFGLRGLAAHRGWATAIGVIYIVETSWLLLAPLIVAAMLRDPGALIALSFIIIASRTLILALGFWMRRGPAARTAAVGYSFAAVAWITLFALVFLERHGIGLPFVVAALGALSESIGHYATGAYFAEQRPVPIDVNAFS